ncbi:hypothetical protein ACFSKY_14425 [Azotobacter chroococcum]|uniref:DHH family phosphoesterase n=1 Tax=Azotobacter chroococcum TaxID=353 RepID=A0A4V2Q745_9GAMM|nr:hypothetical protein [Azotobacter chroococcum]TCL27130.1 hypothetical protein EV691_12710 [Azotobacter chroococcum]
MQYLFVLGARDPEMVIIEGLVRNAGHKVAYAMAGERRVYAGNAYAAERTSARPGQQRGPVVWVECALADRAVPRDLVVDHHHAGDPGFSMPAERFWEGASLGQVCTLLGIEPTQELRLAAAADHCLNAAYLGRCPGITAQQMRAWRLASRAAWQKISPEVLAERIEAGIAQLRTLGRLRIGGFEFADALDRQIPEVAEASAILGVAVMYSLAEPRSGRTKVGALNGSPEMLEAWMAFARDVLDLADVYGSPLRGYAGGYLREGATAG